MNEQMHQHTPPVDDSNGGLSSLIEKLQSIDAENASKMKRFSIFFAILIVFYGILLILHPVTQIIVIVAGFVVFLAIFLFSYKKALRKDYTQPVKELLLQTRKSYRMVSPVYVITCITAFVIIYFSSDTLFSRFGRFTIAGLSPVISQVVVVLIFYFAVLVLAYYVWRRKYHQVIRQIEDCLKELGE